MIEHFHFIRPLWLLLVVPFAALIYLRINRKVRIKTGGYHFPEHLRQALAVGNNGWASYGPVVLLAVMGGIASVILAGPTWQREPSPTGEDIAPLVVVLDVSDSMLEADITPNRLFRAKQKIYQLIEKRNSGTTALVVYSGSAHLAMPLTRDKAVFKPLLDSIAPNVMPRAGKFDQYTLPVIHNALRGTIQTSTVLLVTDSINKESISAWRDYMAHNDSRLLVWGIGNPNGYASIPLDESLLTELAEETDGVYQRFTTDDSDVGYLAKRIESVLDENGDESMPWRDSGYGLIWLLIPIYLLWARRGWLVQWCLIGTVCLFTSYTPASLANELSWDDLWYTQDQRGQKLYDQGDYLKAAETFENLRWKAHAFYMAGDYKLAKNYYLRIDDLSAKLGVGASLAQQKEYVAARRWYQNLLNEYPENEVIQANLALMVKIIKDINQFGEGQSKSHERQSSKELGERPQTSEGVKKIVEQAQVIEETLSAEEILSSPELNEQWMSRVDSKLVPFLANKFYIQLEQGLATARQAELDVKNKGGE